MCGAANSYSFHLFDREQPESMARVGTVMKSARQERRIFVAIVLIAVFCPNFNSRSNCFAFQSNVNSQNKQDATSRSKNYRYTYGSRYRSDHRKSQSSPTNGFPKQAGFNPFPRKNGSAKPGSSESTSQSKHDDEKSARDERDEFKTNLNKLFQAQKFKQIIEACDAFIDIHPNDAYAFACRGVSQYSFKKYELALADLTRAIEISPNYEYALRYRAVTYIMMKKYDLALKDFNRAIELKPRRYFSVANRGYVYFNLKNYESAIKDLTKSISINPEYEYPYRYRGKCKLALGKHEEAISDFTIAIQKNANIVSNYEDRGYSYLNLSKYENAIGDFSKAIELNRPTKSNFWNRGICFLKTGQYQKAVEDIDNVIKIEPTDARFYVARCRAYLHLHQLTEASIDIKKAIELDSQKPSLHLLQYAIQSQSGSPNNAVETFNGYIATQSGGKHKSWNEQLENGTPAERMEIILALGCVRPPIPGADHALNNVMLSGSKEEKTWAFEAVKSLGPHAAGASRALAGLIAEKNEDAKTAAAILEKLGPKAKAAIPVLHPLLYHDNPDVRLKVASIMFHIDRNTCVDVAPVIAELATKTVKGTKRKSTLKSEAELRKKAFQQLRSMGEYGKPAMPTIAKFIIVHAGSNQFGVECASMINWFSIFGKDAQVAIPAIKHFLETAYSWKKDHLQDFQSNYHGQQYAIRAALRLLSKLESVDRLLGPSLTDFLRIENDSDTRKLIADLLPGGVVEKLDSEFSQIADTFEEAGVQEKIIFLAWIKSRPLKKSFVSAINSALRDELPIVRESACSSAATFREQVKELTPALVEVLNSDNTRVELAAIHAINCINPRDPKVLSSYLKVFERTNQERSSEVRRRAIDLMISSKIDGLVLLPGLLNMISSRYDMTASDRRVIHVISGITGWNNETIFNQRDKLKKYLAESRNRSVVEHFYDLEPSDCYLAFALRGDASDIELVRLFHAAAKNKKDSQIDQPIRLIGKLNHTDALLDLLHYRNTSDSIPIGMAMVGPAAVKPLLDLVAAKPANDFATRNAIRSIELIASKYSLELTANEQAPLGAFLSSGTTELRLAALNALYEINKDNLDLVLHSVLQNDDPQVLMLAVEKMSGLETKETELTHDIWERLHQMYLNQSEVNTKIAILKAMISIYPPRLTESLKTALRDQQLELQLFAADILIKKAIENKQILLGFVPEMEALVTKLQPRFDKRFSDYLHSSTYRERVRRHRSIITTIRNEQRRKGRPLTKDDPEELAKADFFDSKKKETHILNVVKARLQRIKDESADQKPGTPANSTPVTADEQRVSQKMSKTDISQIDMAGLVRNYLGFDLEKRQQAESEMKTLINDSAIDFEDHSTNQDSK